MMQFMHPWLIACGAEAHEEGQEMFGTRMRAATFGCLAPGAQPCEIVLHDGTTEPTVEGFDPRGRSIDAGYGRG